MRLPPGSTGFVTRVTYGRYVWRRLMRIGAHDLAATVNAVNEALLVTGRRLEDLQLPEMEALADRDADDDLLDETAREMRLRLSARGLDATRERPYTDIFPDGIEHYVAATLALQSTRYGELIQRTVEHLPEADPVRVEDTPKLEAQIARWEQSAAAVGQARNTLAIARTARDAAVEDWTVSLERVYGALVNRFDKKQAERFFPRTSRKRTEVEVVDEDAAEEDGASFGPTN